MIIQEFDFEVKDLKVCENHVTNHISLLESNHLKLGEIKFDDNFPDKLVVSLLGSIEPWWVDYIDYIMGGLLHDDLNHY